jgi:ketosteroid isomerase-like protein
MPQRSNSEIVRALFAAYIQKHRGVIEDLLAEDFTFTSPLDDGIDRAAYFEHCWPNSDKIRNFDIERVAEEGDGVFVTYRCTLTDGKEFGNTEFFRVESGKVRSVDVYFGRTLKEAG